MRQRELRQKAALLKICRDDLTDVCNELDGLRPYKWYLKLAHP